MPESTLIAVDLAKSVFQIAVATGPRSVTDHRVHRPQFLAFFANRPPATIFMEACGTAHPWGRQLQDLGHEVRLLPPQYVRPYVKRNKTDRADAHAILEAARNAEIHYVPIKSVEQQILASLHRLRSGWIAERTAQLNTVRGLLREQGHVIALGAEKVIPRVREIVGDPENNFPDALRHPFHLACEGVRDLELHIADVQRQIDSLARISVVATRLQTIPGVGVLTATALLAFVGDVRRFPTARHFASYLGLTPREYSTGQRRRLGHISKRGDAYIRMLLVHGARSVLLGARRLKQPDRLRTWALHLAATRSHNIAAVAVANKLARIVWAVWRSESSFASLPPAV